MYQTQEAEVADVSPQCCEGHLMIEAIEALGNISFDEPRRVLQVRWISMRAVWQPSLGRKP